MQTETLDQILNSDLAGQFDISREQAERIASRAKDGDDFVRIWENEDWWVNLTFDQFFETAERMDVTSGARLLRMDERFFEGDDEIIVFDSDCYITRQGQKYSALVYREEYVGAEIDAAKFLYFEHWVWECATHSEEFLTQFYNEWLTWQRLPECCAFELLMGAELTPYQVRWLNWFSDVWQEIAK